MLCADYQSLILSFKCFQTISSWPLQVKLNPGALEFDHILKSSMLDGSITAVTSRHSACFYNLHVLLTCRWWSDVAASLLSHHIHFSNL